MIRKMICEMTLHVGAEDVALELFEEVVKVELEVARSAARVLARAASPVVGASLLRVGQNFVG
jgi:hypothetical protein